MRQKVRIYLDKSTYARLEELAKSSGVPLAAIYLSAWRLGQIMLIFKVSLGDVEVNCSIPENYESVTLNIPNSWLKTTKNIAKILDVEVSKLNRFCIHRGCNIAVFINTLEEMLNAPNLDEN